MCNNPGNFTEAFGSFKLQVLMLFPVYKDFFLIITLILKPKNYKNKENINYNIKINMNLESKEFL